MGRRLANETIEVMGSCMVDGSSELFFQIVSQRYICRLFLPLFRLLKYTARFVMSIVKKN